MPSSDPYKFTKGDHVELLKPDPKGTTIAYHLATVLRSPALHKNLVFVETGDHLIKEYVDLNSLRPVPPRQLHECFMVGDDVDAYFEGDKLWSRGKIKDVLENSKYIFGDDQIEVDHWNLRLHREWDHGSWVPPLVQNNKLPNTEMKPAKVKKLKIRFSQSAPETEFRKGELVEVSSDEEGFKGAWFLAKVIECKDDDKVLIEYLTLQTEDGSQLLQEEIKVEFIRPLPPQIPPVACFERLQLVDALYNEGWWLGMISKVLKDFKYIVYFHTSNEELEFQHSNLRPHQDWIGGKWKIASKL